MHFSPNAALLWAAARFRDALDVFHATFPTDSSVEFEKWTILTT
jgi:hypothetical protein